MLRETIDPQWQNLGMSSLTVLKLPNCHTSFVPRIIFFNYDMYFRKIIHVNVS